MKTLLIFPPSTIYGDDPTIPAIVPPLGLAYIAGYLEHHSHSVEILDARAKSGNRIIREKNKKQYGLTDEEIRDYIKKASPGIIGVSCMYTAYSGDAHRVARIVKEIDKGIPVIMGGAHASTFPDLVLKDSNVDAIVHGEGEETFKDLVENYVSKKDFYIIPGISYRKNGKIEKNPIRPFIKDIDIIPFPARHLLDMDLYLKSVDNTYTMRAPSTTIITSRGCPHSCIYCTIQSVWGNKRWRGRSPLNVVDEMEMLHKDYNVQEFLWMDDSAGTSKKRLQKICEEIIKRKLNIRWTTPNGIAHWYLDEATLFKMKAAGCYRVTFGIESGNIETRKFLGKPYPLDQAKKMIQYANRIGMWTICTHIIGFPYENKAAIMDTIKFAANSGMDLAVFYLLCPHPGTRVYDIFKKEGLLNLDHMLDPSLKNGSFDLEQIGRKLAGKGSKTKKFTSNELQIMLAHAYKIFFKARIVKYLNLLHLSRKVRSYEDLKYLLKISKYGINSAIYSLSSKNRFSSQIFRN